MRHGPIETDKKTIERFLESKEKDLVKGKLIELLSGHQNKDERVYDMRLTPNEIRDLLEGESELGRRIIYDLITKTAVDIIKGSSLISDNPLYQYLRTGKEEYLESFYRDENVFKL